MTILMLADPDLATRRLLAVLAARSGRWPCVAEVSSVKEAVATATRSPVGLIVSELRFGDGDVRALLRVLAESRGGVPPLVVFTADVLGAADHHEELVRLGARHVITKPVGVDVLARVLALDVPIDIER